MTGSAGPAGSPLRSEDPPTVGAYRLVSLLGEGGMGQVYLARSPAGRLVAVKLIRTNAAKGEEFRRRFRGEVARARQVPPFCTAEVLDADPDHDPPYLVVEYVDGPSLSSVVREHGPLSPANLHGLAIGVATALVAIHSAGVIHRDLKAANVLLAPGSPKVIDFGLAREIDAPTQNTTTGEVVGTVAYMSPERLEPAGRELTPAADIFSWGAVVGFAGTGRAPFQADTLPGVAYRIMTEPPDLDGLTGDLRELAEQALAKDPAARPTARELLDRLLAAGPPGGRGGDPATVPTNQTELLRTGRRHAQVEPAADGTTAALPGSPRPRRRRRLAVLALTAAAILALGVAAVAATPLLAGDDRAPNAGPPTSAPAESSSPAAVIPAGAQLVVRDPLTAPEPWQVITDEQTDTTCRFAGGLVVTSQAASFRCRGPRDTLADLAVFVDVTLAEPGSCASVWFRFTVKGGGYVLRVCEDGFYLATHGVPEPANVKPLREFRFDNPLAEPTRIGIVAEAEQLRFYRDGDQVGRWSDSTFTSGQVWLGMLQMRPEIPPPYQATFSDIEIWGRGG